MATGTTTTFCEEKNAVNIKRNCIFSFLAISLILIFAGVAAAQTDKATGGVDENLSGDYTGHVEYMEGGASGRNISGNGTLHIDGNNFTLTVEGSDPITGRVSAVNTRHYIGASFRMGDWNGSTKESPPPVPQASVRVRRMGNTIWLTPVEGSGAELTFGMAGGGRHRRGRRAAEPMCGPM
jgi:hypothetical protein